jgi:hypothetical protein
MYLTLESVVDYCKRNLGYPIATIELSDSEIEHIIMKITLPFFSSYVPDKRETVLTETTSDSQNTFIINDPDNATIFDVVEIIQDLSNELVTSDPRSVLPLMSPSTVPDFLNSTMIKHLQKQYSLMWPSWRFIPPNLVRVFPKISTSNSYYIARYTREHVSLSTIPANYARDFQDLCFCDVAISLYAARSKYASYTTPYGDINLNPDSLYTRYTDMRTNIIERLKKRPPDVILYVR